VYSTFNSDLLGTLKGNPDFSAVVDDPNSDLTSLGTVEFTSGTTTIIASSNNLTHLSPGQNRIRDALVLERAAEPTIEPSDDQAKQIGVAIDELDTDYATNTVTATNEDSWPDTARICIFYVPVEIT